jgi:hypothetical protein
MKILEYSLKAWEMNVPEKSTIFKEKYFFNNVVGGRGGGNITLFLK